MMDIVKSTNPSINTISKALGEADIKAMLVEVLADLVSFFNVGKMMNASQLMSTAELILEAYGMYKIDDWVLMSKRAKLGSYGTVYDRIDGNVIFDWFDKYLEERNAEFENARLKEKKLLEADIIPNPEAIYPDKDKPVPMPDYIKEAFKKKIVTHTPVRVLNQSEEQKEINRWMYEFDKLWEDQGAAEGKRIVFIKREVSRSEREKLLNEIEKEYQSHKISNPTMADSIKARAIKGIDFIKMDISEYLQYRHQQKAA